MDAQEVMHMTNYSKITALYSRLSVGDEDRDGGESNSIQNQKIFLENYARGQHLTNIRHYIDDDESGRFFDRSAYRYNLHPALQGSGWKNGCPDDGRSVCLRAQSEKAGGRVCLPLRSGIRSR